MRFFLFKDKKRKEEKEIEKLSNTPERNEWISNEIIQATTNQTEETFPPNKKEVIPKDLEIWRVRVMQREEGQDSFA
jgi:hypothetical protein